MPAAAKPETKLQKIEGFFGSVVKFFGKLAKNTSWQTTAQAILIAVSAAAENILALSGNEVGAAAVAVVVNEIKAGFAALSALIAQYDSQTHTSFVAQASAIIDDIVADLGTLLSAGQIKDAKTITGVTKWVTVISSDAKSLLTLIPAAPVPTTS
jgi:hypothetical protein